jgi:anhydro-N-acetylmuramic acid kinase
MLHVSLERGKFNPIKVIYQPSTTFVSMNKEKNYKVIGIMSGTSLDGLDMVACDLQFVNGAWAYHVLVAETLEYTSYWKKSLRKCRQFSAVNLLKLDFEFGGYMGTLVNDFLRRHDIEVDLIASHGHTVFHQPEEQITYQIGNGTELRRTTGLPVVYDFRTSDVLGGGQGAPLVPVGDRLLFGEYDYCLNIGGIANISYESAGFRKAYDVCPANMALNWLAGKLGREYDEDGVLAEKGAVLPEKLKELNALPYYEKSPPKSLGCEDVEKWFLPLFSEVHAVPDLIMTAIAHIGDQVSKAVEGGKGKSMLVTGGGAHHPAIVDMLKEKTACQIVVPDKEIVDFKEALIFALLGVLRVRNEINVLASVTGGQKDICSGVYLP